MTVFPENIRNILMSTVNESINLATKKTCVGCMACVDVCPQNAIERYVDNDGHAYVKINNEKCIKCHKCDKLCAKLRSNYGDNAFDKSTVYAAWSLNTDVRKNATSGGVFFEIAKIIIEDYHGIVVGAQYDGRECKHICVDNMDALIGLQGSKYVTSSTHHIYKEIESALSKSVVLFTGTGCQCSAVISYFEKHANFSNLYTMDLVCGGVPSNILVDRYLEDNKDISRIIKFREKDKYQMSVEKAGKIVKIGERSLPLHGFACGLTNRYSCYDCKFACVHRKTDFTIGDLWNYDIFREEHKNGVSMIITHSRRGDSIFKKANVFSKALSWSDVLYSNHRIIHGRAPIFSPRRKLEENIIALDKQDFYKLYTMSMNNKDVKMQIFRIYRYIKIKLNFIYTNARIWWLLKVYRKKED